MNKKYNHNTYDKFSKINKKIRDSSISPSAFSKIEEKGIGGKIVSSIGSKIIEDPLHKTTRKVVGSVYNRSKHKPYVGSVLYTIFKWGLLLLLASCPPLLILMLVTGVFGKLKKKPK
jgi:hypothetical protein